MGRTDLNDAQWAVLDWVADGCPDGVFTEGMGYRVSAAALRARGLVSTRGRGSLWSAALTSAGALALKQRHEPAPQVQTPAPTPQPERLRESRRSPKPDAAPEEHTPRVEALAAQSRARSEPPDDFRGAHKLIGATRAAAKGLKEDATGRITVGPRAGVFYLIVSREQLRPALLILHAIGVEAKKRGWDFVALERDVWRDRSGAALQVGQHTYGLEIRELTELHDFTTEEIEAWRNPRYGWQSESRANKMPPPQLKRKTPTGQLRLSVQGPFRNGGHRQTWSAGRRGDLGRQLPSILDSIADREAEDDARVLRQEQAAQARQAAEAETAERRRRWAIAQQRGKRLGDQAAAWRQAQDLRDYVAALTAATGEASESDRDRLMTWADWGGRWADALDPLSDLSKLDGLE